MGRTIPSWRMILEEELNRWRKFQDSLRIDSREIFEDLMNECRRYASAAGAATFPLKTEGMFLSILFAHHKRLKELCDKVDRIHNLLEKNDQTH
ncbi:MAG: hypothetical protein NTX81_11015 [Candidatus Bathyarchaeota archaeon]|jgi:hypothetical protein|nr:hypothetical protein [Candidatus Bathyarchaeota archaeon]MCX6660878.1 hypothetical protein [Candidatus Bathyarchaeota archaeon]